VPRLLRVATRGSALARWQAERIAGRLEAAGFPSELVLVQTTGDVRLDVPLHAIGGQGVFVKEVQQAVLDGRADLAVHSAKDLPSSLATPGLVLASVPERGDPRDALVGCRLADLRPGVTVATGSVRRQAQLEGLVPGLRFVDLRGNIQTRLTKVPEGGAVVMAAAALQRLGLAAEITEILDPEVMVPQVAQGALAVECRDGDHELREVLAALEDVSSRAAVDAERAYLATFGAGCDLPVGAHAAPDGSLRAYARFVGGFVHRATSRWVPHAAAAAGRAAGEAALADARAHGAA
jgi:hydroxymethylbilane synthase